MPDKYQPSAHPLSRDGWREGDGEREVRLDMAVLRTEQGHLRHVGGQLGPAGQLVRTVLLPVCQYLRQAGVVGPRVDVSATPITPITSLEMGCKEDVRGPNVLTVSKTSMQEAA